MVLFLYSVKMLCDSDHHTITVAINIGVTANVGHLDSSKIKLSYSNQHCLPAVDLHSHQMVTCNSIHLRTSNSLVAVTDDSNPHPSHWYNLWPFPCLALLGSRRS